MFAHLTTLTTLRLGAHPNFNPADAENAEAHCFQEPVYQTADEALDIDKHWACGPLEYVYPLRPYLTPAGADKIANLIAN